jgi:hypothetical protein
MAVSRHCSIFLWLVVSTVLPCVAVAAETEEPPLEEIVVTGEFRGPGLWRVTRADDPAGHVLWIVGDPWGLPKGMKWKSKEIEAIATGSQEILRDASVSVVPDEQIGMFRGLTLLPAAMKARKNPDDKTLDELLPPDLHARWVKQRQIYLRGTKGLEDWRPIFAADRLRTRALEKLNLRERGVVWDVIGKLVEDAKVPVTAPAVKFTFKRDEVRAKIKEFSRESLADQECFRVTLDLTESLANREVETARAQAWAQGDVEALAALPPQPNPYLPCAMAVLSSQVARQLIPDDIRAQTEKLWLDAVDAALAKNASTFAVVPIGKLMREDGYVAKLRSRGLVVELPR